jgi:hypothetical protein
MKQDLKEEIYLIKKNMGLISEDIRTQGIELAGEILKFLESKVTRRFGGLATNPYEREMKELTKYVERGSATNSDEIESIFAILMKKEPKIEKMIGDMMYSEWKKQNPDAIKKFENYLITPNIKNRVPYVDHLEKLEDVINNLPLSRLNSGFKKTEINDAIKIRLKSEVEKRSFEKYNTLSQQFMKGMKDSWKFDKGVGLMEFGRYSRFRLEEWFRKAKQLVTNKPWGKWENFYKKFGYTPEQIKVLNEWSIAGFPDSPSILRSLRQKGILYGTGRGAAQLLRKYVQLTLFWWALNSLVLLFDAIIENEPSPEFQETLEKYGDWGEGVVVVEKILSSLDLAPGLKYTSPATFFGLGAWDAVKSAQVNRDNLKNRLIAYGKPRKDGKFSIKPYLMLKENFQNLKKLRDKISKEFEQIKPLVVKDTNEFDYLQNYPTRTKTDTTRTTPTPKTTDSTKTTIIPTKTDTIKPATVDTTKTTPPPKKSTGAPVPDLEKILGGN